MGESSSKSVISVNSNHRSVSEEKTRHVDITVSDNIQQKSNLNGNCHKIKLTLQDYRKQIGLRVINQKPTQKIGITAKPETNLEEKCYGQLPLSASAICPHCGFSTNNTNKCMRCMRTFEKEKIVHLSSDLESLPGNKLSGVSQMSKDSSYGNRRPRTQNAQPTRQTRAKFEEPQCVTLSSDEDDDSFQETKKIKCDNTHKPSEDLVDSVLIQEQQINKEYESSNSNLINSPVDVAEKGGLNDFLCWKEGGLSGPFFAVNCRSVRIGSYKFTPVGRVLFSSEGIILQAPVFHDHHQPTEKSSVWINVVIPAKQLLQVDVHFNRQLPVIFLNVTPNLCRRISVELGLLKNGPYWDSLSDDESKKRLILLPSNLDDSAKNAIKQAFVPKGVFREINYAETNRLLVISSPVEVRDAIKHLPSGTDVLAETSVSASLKKDTTTSKEGDSKVEVRTTRGSSKSIERVVLPVTPMFSWSDGPDRFSVTTEDYACLNQDNLLNDSIIDFYVRFIFSTKLDDNLKSKCHVFSSFFYQRLTTRPPKINGRKHPIEDDATLSLKEKRHSRVKSWTKKVDIFEKDYLVIPINERNHWFLAIVCFPGLSGPVTVKDNRPIKLNPQQTYSQKTSNDGSYKNGSFHIGNTTITPINANSRTTKDVPITLNVDTERDEAESDEEDILFPLDNNSADKSSEVSDPIKQPCILFFDSLVGSAHNRVATTLREYLMVEYQIKKRKLNENVNVAVENHVIKTCNLFSKETMISACLDVPQQNNSYDCGIFVLQYAEYFMINPFVDYNLPNIKLRNWFPPYIAGRKRKNIQFLLIRLTKETNPLADEILKVFVSEDDMKHALHDRQSSRTSSVGTINNEIQCEDSTIMAMEKDNELGLCPDKETVEMEVSPNIVYGPNGK